MRLKRPLLLGTLVVTLAVAGGAFWQLLPAGEQPEPVHAQEMPAPPDPPRAAPPPPGAEPSRTPDEASPNAPGDDTLPLPPEPPRLTSGPDYERCLGMLRTDPDGARAFADAWEATGGGEGAQHCFALALIAGGEPERAAGRLEQIAGRSNATNTARAAVYAQAGQAWMMVGRPERAFGAITLALSLTPTDIDLLIDRSIASANMNRFADSIDDLNRAVDLDPMRADAWVFRAAAWRHLDRIELAADDVARALEVAPDNAEALLERGIIRQLRGDAAGARADWERAMELAPNTATADLAQQNLALNEAGPQRR